MPDNNQLGSRDQQNRPCKLAASACLDFCTKTCNFTFKGALDGVRLRCHGVGDLEGLIIRAGQLHLQASHPAQQALAGPMVTITCVQQASRFTLVSGATVFAIVQGYGQGQAPTKLRAIAPRCHAQVTEPKAEVTSPAAAVPIVGRWAMCKTVVSISCPVPEGQDAVPCLQVSRSNPPHPKLGEVLFLSPPPQGPLFLSNSVPGWVSWPSLCIAGGP